MQRNNNNNSEMTFLVEDIEAVLEMNRLLEKENQELKHEVARLKSQIASLKAHDIERKSTLWKKLQYPSSVGNKEESLQKQTVQSLQTSEQLRTPVSESKKPSPSPPPPCKQIVPQDSDMGSMNNGPPPPPPPLPSKLLLGSKLAVRRVPEVIEFYRYLNKRNAKIENRTNKTTASKEVSPGNMIGEIENKSMYLSAVKSDVEMQREFINYLIREVETAVFTDISAVEAFVKRLDGELSSLVDERAVLKHFPQWPERKADALREAACCFRDLKSIESETFSYKDKTKQPLPQTLRRIQTLQDRLERVIENIEKTREGTCRRYKEMQIPWDWMLDTGLVGQIKLNSLKLAREYMKRIIKELDSSRLPSSEDIIHQGARFAYRVHQFTGGFDLDTEQVFEELKRIHSANSPQACKA
ncbi:protein CHUP1, chloroplastic-like [Chenopodium quinoa]|uniref:protein CHUP1, chloroplastic-like n=1 Tax=Chenopodium quinoa TaxID=63459 RepID=UPI000B788045|nr:protein CHUP1, chloroplastic-like [Chenopodium quinoa]